MKSNQKKRTIREIRPRGKRVLVRVDFNVPLNDSGVITDDKRIVESLPTIRYLLERGAAVILCSHLGRPKGKIVPSLSLAPVAKRLSELLPGVSVKFASDAIDAQAQDMARKLNTGEILLLENLRFYPEEEKNDPVFAKTLASMADEYVSDAFGTVHRAHASTVGVAKFLPASCGFLIEKELRIIQSTLEDPDRPFVAVLGGAKVENKIGVIKNLMTKCDAILIGGAMAYTFIKAMGYEVGTSLVADDYLHTASELMEQAKAQNIRLIFPKDVIVASEFAPDAQKKMVSISNIPADMMGMDIGEATREEFAGIIKEAGTVIWNGPMGVFEFPAFAFGTKTIALACGECAGVTIVGGGDSAAAINSMGIAGTVTHVSTGGGATLELLEGRVLPGIDVIEEV